MSAMAVQLVMAAAIVIRGSEVMDTATVVSTHHITQHRRLSHDITHTIAITASGCNTILGSVVQLNETGSQNVRMHFPVSALSRAPKCLARARRRPF